MAGYYRVARALLELEVAQKEWEAKRNHESKSFGVQFCISRSARPRLLDLISQALQKWAPSRAGAERIDSRSCFGLSACTGFHVAPVNRGRTSLFVGNIFGRCRSGQRACAEASGNRTPSHSAVPALRGWCALATVSQTPTTLTEAYELLQRALPTMLATQQFVGSEGAAAKHLVQFSTCRDVAST